MVMEPVNIANANGGSLKEASSRARATENDRKECRRLAGELYDALGKVGVCLVGLHMEAQKDDHHAHEVIGALKTHITYRRIKDE